MSRGNPLKESSGSLRAIHSDTKEPTGFENRIDSSLAWSDSGPDRTLTIDKTGTGWSFYVQAKKFTKTAAETIQITDIEGLHYIYYDTSGVLQVTTTFTEALITDWAWVADILWDATNSIGKLWHDRHGIVMDGRTHAWMHKNIGMVYGSGLALSDFSIDNGSQDSHAQFSSSLGIVSDEDIDFSISASLSTDGHEIWYLDGSDWRWETIAGFSVKNLGAGRLAFNDSGSQTEVGNNNFVLSHIFATGLADGKLITIQGQQEYGNIIQAREGAVNEITILQLNGLPGPEMRYIAAVIFKTSNTYANSVKARVELTDEGDNYVDFRTSKISQSSSPTDHGNLGGLGDDDHPQYKLLDGRASDITPLNAATYTLLATDKIVHTTYTPTGPITSITVPSAQIAGPREFTIKDGGGNAEINNITIDTEGSETINGAATFVISTNSEAITLYSYNGNLYSR